MGEFWGSGWDNHGVFGVDSHYLQCYDDFVVGPQSKAIKRCGNALCDYLCSSACVSCKNNIYGPWVNTTGSSPQGGVDEKRHHHTRHVQSLSNIQTAKFTSLSDMQSMHQSHGPPLPVDEQLRWSL